jgi:hypothetical protein
VYNAAKATLLHEFRRGADRAQIYSIAFAPQRDYLAAGAYTRSRFSST